jgi:hypothetical protein
MRCQTNNERPRFFIQYVDAPLVSFRQGTEDEFRQQYERNLKPSYLARKQADALPPVETSEG